MPVLRIIGNGRAGGALALALEDRGWIVRDRRGRGDAVHDAAQGVDLLVISTPDASIADVAGSVRPSTDGTTVVAHLAGSLGLDVLRAAGHRRVTAIHPLVSLPDAALGARRLVGAWFAVAGDPMGAQVVAALDGRSFSVADEDRAAYHAAACIASNHTVALLGQVERISASIGVPMDGYLDLVRATVENVAQLGAPAALTGPAARGDWGTIERHREALGALGPDEVAMYDAMVRAARRLVDEPPEP